MMFRCIRILSYNIVLRPHQQQQSSFFLRWNSSVAHASDIEIKVNTERNIEKFSEKEEIDKKKKEFEGTFANINDVSSLLKTATAAFKIDYAFKALDLLADWSDTKNIKFDEVEKDQNYEKFVSVLEKKAHGRTIEEIIRALKNLRTMGVPSSNFLIESLENDLLWNIRKVSVSSLVTILEFQIGFQETERQQKVVEQTILSIERRWTEVKCARDFSVIYFYSNCFSPSLQGHIDDLVIETSENKNVHDLARIFVAIRYSKRRPTPVLRTLAYYMFKKQDQMTPREISNVLHAMNSLNFHDEMLLGKLSSNFLAQIERIDLPSIIGGVALCMGQLRWKEKDLLDALGQWVIKNINICRCNDVASLIITLANVYHIPDNIDELLSICSPKLDMNLIMEKNIWVDIVWALVVLGKATHEQIAAVLQPVFIAEFDISDPSCVGSYLKLMNISAAAEVLETSYNGPKLQFEANSFLITHSRKDLALLNHVQKVLRNFLPPPKYVRENVQTKYGFMIDAEIAVDKLCKPLELPNLSSESTNEKKSKPLPTGASRIAIMVWNYRNYTIASTNLTGQNALAIRILKKLGYKVLEVPYYDINKKENIAKSVQYFEKKIKEIVGK